LAPLAWDERRARALIARIAEDAAARFVDGMVQPAHPRDGAPAYERQGDLYAGAGGVLWALHQLHALGASRPSIDAAMVDATLQRHREWQASFGGTEFASYFMGDIALLLLAYDLAPTEALADRIEELIGGNMRHPARELMWGSPGTLLVALFLAHHTRDARWSALFRATAHALSSELEWSPQHACHYWTQDLRGQRGTFLGAVHGFAGVAAVIVRGRKLLAADEWHEWEQRIETSVARTATVVGESANWRAHLLDEAATPPAMRMQFCHGAPGFVICLAALPGPALDHLLLAGGEATWQAGPLVKGANLCHGTGGNGYAFLKLFRRTGDERWLTRARAFAMHGIVQCERDAVRFGQMHASLWTGDLGFATYLWNCIVAGDDFPCLDVFFAPRGAPQ
jgi:hypothetical protein